MSKHSLTIRSGPSGPGRAPPLPSVSAQARRPLPLLVVTATTAAVNIGLNLLLIPRGGLLGAAYAFLITITFYNAMRFFFLWYKFGFQPYTTKNLLIVLIAVLAVGITYFTPTFPNVFIDSIIRSAIFLIIIIPTLYFAKISEEVNGIIDNLKQKLPF